MTIDPKTQIVAEWDVNPHREVGVRVKERYPELRQTFPYSEPGMPLGIRRKLQRVLLQCDQTAEFTWKDFKVLVKVSPPDYLARDEDDDTLRRRVTAQAEWLIPTLYAEPSEEVEWTMVPPDPKVRFGMHAVVTVADVRDPAFSDAVWVAVGMALDAVKLAIRELPEVDTLTSVDDEEQQR